MRKKGRHTFAELFLPEEVYKDYDKLLGKYMRPGENGVGLDLTLVSLILMSVGMSQAQATAPYNVYLKAFKEYAHLIYSLEPLCGEVV